MVSVLMLPGDSAMQEQAELIVGEASKSVKVLATGVVDLHLGRLIDVVAGRSRKVLEQLRDWTLAFEVAALDRVSRIPPRR